MTSGVLQEYKTKSGKQQCSECLQWLPATPEFYNKNSGTNKDRYPYHHMCKSCRTDYVRFNRYGISKGMYLKMLEKQGGGCAICKLLDPGWNFKVFCIDHDHSCCPEVGRSCGSCVRGLLCHSCNAMIGAAKDNLQILQAAVDYVTGRSKEQEL